MNLEKYVFSQIMELVSPTSLQTIVNRHLGNYKVKNLSCWKQFLCMAFEQLTHRESLSDTTVCLKANANKMYHVGIGEVVAISSITRANESRSFQIYQDLAMLLIIKSQAALQNSFVRRILCYKSKRQQELHAVVFSPKK